MIVGDKPYLIGSKVSESDFENLEEGRTVGTFGKWLLSDAKEEYGMLACGYENGLIVIIVLE